MVAVGSADLKTVLPATNTSAPAAIIDGALSNVTPPSITSMIKKMEQEGYITRKADEQDQRVMRLTLAQKGRDSIAYVIKTAEKLEEKVFEGMSAEEKMLFRRLLLQIIENVE